MSRRSMLFLVVLVALLVFVLETPLAAQELDEAPAPGGRSTGETNDTFDETVEVISIRFVSEWANPVQQAPRGHDVNTDWAEPTVESGPPAYGSPQCARGVSAEYEPLFDIWYSAYCTHAWVCGGERIDEMVTGEVAGQEASGVYAEFLDEMVGLFAADGGGGAGVDDVDSVNDFILANGLDDDRPSLALPVFYWCGARRLSTGEVDLIIADPDPGMNPHFGWDTEVDIEYNLPGLRNDALTELRALLGFYRPDIKATPPAEQGYTFVNWNTWYSIATPVAPMQVFEHNDTNTLQVEVRAIFNRVDFKLDGAAFETCAADEMVEYVKDFHDPVDDLPACHYKFTDEVTGDLSATVFFDIQTRELQRNAGGDPWPDIPWTPLPEEQVDLTSVIADYQVRPIYTVNIPIDATAEDIAALRAAAD